MTSPGSSSSRSPTLLGDNLVVTGGKFTQLNDHSITNVIASKGGLDRLQDEVATAAFHNSAQRIDPPKCHPKTREAVLTSITDWIASSDDRDAWIMWLLGAAGAGKSAIMQSIAELCAARGILIASFFFSRTDPTRNSIGPLVATLAYQLTLIIPATRRAIIEVIEHDPLIFKKSLADQFESLISIPVSHIGRLSSSTGRSYGPLLLLVIDGLDECNDRNAQATLIRTLSDISASKVSPLIFLISSRSEPHLKMAFSAKKITPVLTRLALDDNYLPDVDIRLFLTAKFAEIKYTHPLRHLLCPDWPPRPLVESIIEKSSGQFIFAAVIIRYISLPSGHPGHRLEVCCRLRPARSETPFAQLDALYRHIFSQVQDLDLTRPVLAMALYTSTQIMPITTLLRLEKGSVESCLSDLTSVICCKGPYIKFLHGSLSDYLGDPERSEEYYIDQGIWCAYFALLWFKRLGTWRPDIPVNPVSLRDADQIIHFLERADPIHELQHELFKLAPTIENNGGWMSVSDLFGLVSAVRALNFDDSGEVYGCIFLSAARYLKIKFPAEYSQLLREHSTLPATTLAILEVEEPKISSEGEESANSQEDQKTRMFKRKRFIRWLRKHVLDRNR